MASASSSPSLEDAVSRPPVARLLSSGCNRSPAAMVWLPQTHAKLYPQGLIAYAAGNNVAIYDPALAIIVALMRGHRARVNAVQWIEQTSGQNNSSSPTILRLASGGADKQLIIWHYDTAARSYAVQARLIGHEEGISAVSAVAIVSDSKRISLLATTSTDLTTRVWICENGIENDSAVLADSAAVEQPSAESGGWRCLQVLQSGRHRIMHCLSLLHVPLPSHRFGGLLLLGVAGVDGKVHLWLSASPSSTHQAYFAQASSALEGHENWITSLDWAILDPEVSAGAATSAPAVSLMLASASQDRHIRLWKLQITLPLTDSALIFPSAVSTTSLGSRGLILDFAGISILVVLESVLSAHENWVMSARWQPAQLRTDTDGRVVRHQPLALVSSSTDKSMLVWSPSLQSVWHHNVRVGDMGGHTMGFYGCAFSPLGDAILANGYSGSLHLWRKEMPQPSDSTNYNIDTSYVRWTPSVTVSGHAGSVNDLSWDAQGDFLYSTSSDQTTRLWAQWNQHNVPPAESRTSVEPARPSWHEISRPQLHGYDLNCVAPLYDPLHIRAHCMVSGADEKVMRVFWAPVPFLETLRRIAGVETVEADAATAVARPAEPAVIPDEGRGDGGGDEEDDGSSKAALREAATAASAVPKGGNPEQLAFLDAGRSRALEANLPELGLSNKALRDGESANRLRGIQHVQEAVSAAAHRAASQPPPEDYLLTHTLWPEVEKLYGHGFEIISLACNYEGTLVASACIAKKSQHAVVRVWETKEWAEIIQLESHRSSVVQLQFSPDNRYLLSVSRDRHVSLFQFRTPYIAGLGKDVLIGSTKLRVHARIIWSCSWVPLRGAHWFATGSRDKTVKIFWVNDQGAPVEDATLPVFNTAVTSVAFAPLAPSSAEIGFPSVDQLAVNSRPLTLAVGLEDGRMELWQTTVPFRANISKLQWVHLYTFHSNMWHSGRVRRMCWRWRTAPTPTDSYLELATCGEDQSVRVFSLTPAFLFRSH